MDKDALEELKGLFGGGKDDDESGDKAEGFVSSSKEKYVGVLQKVATAARDVEAEYRQALLLSTFLDREDATRVVAALSERQRYGVDITPIVNLVTAWSAVKGADGGRVRAIIEGLTHQTTTMNASEAFKKAARSFGSERKSQL